MANWNPPAGTCRRHRTWAWLLVPALAAGSIGCASLHRPTPPGLSVQIRTPILIPAGRAHAILQNGRLAGTSNKLAPYCELEVRTVSGDEPQRIGTGDFRVSGVSHRILLDPTTRIPAISMLSSCADPLYQESIWHLSSATPSDILFLRCLAPYHNCAFGPPLSVDQTRQQVAPYLEIRVAESTAGPDAPLRKAG